MSWLKDKLNSIFQQLFTRVILYSHLLNKIPCYTLKIYLIKLQKLWSLLPNDAAFFSQCRFTESSRFRSVSVYIVHNQSFLKSITVLTSIPKHISFF